MTKKRTGGRAAEAPKKIAEGILKKGTQDGVHLYLVKWRSEEKEWTNWETKGNVPTALLDAFQGYIFS